MPVFMISGKVWITTEIFIWVVSHPVDRISESPRSVENNIDNC